MEDRRVSDPQTAESRRDVMRKMAYAAPLVLSLAARPAFASSGSCGCDVHHGAQSPSRSNSRQSHNN
jgi:hypothetical protein